MLLMQQTFSYGQKKVSIYELGDSITSCETNFNNLFTNWTANNITNADEYRFFGYSFLETITDSVRFNHYRNYFSGAEQLTGSISGSHREDGVFISIGGSHKVDKKIEKVISKLYITPGFIHGEIYDPRGLPEKSQELLSDDFRNNAKKILTRDFNIDTMHLNYYFYDYNRIDTIVKVAPYFDSFGIRKTYSHQKAASPDSISKNYIDIFIKGNRKLEELSLSEKRNLLLEQMLIERINRQLEFNEQVCIGDKVYVVKFEYKGRRYSDYVICSAKHKKVVMDGFFNSIKLDPPQRNLPVIVK